MYAYIALTWDAGDSAESSTAATLQHQLQSLQDFQIVLAAPGICIAQKAGLNSACGACLLPANNGAVLGTVFSWPMPGQTPQRQLAIAASDSARINETEGRHLVTRFWGRYVAFIRSPQTNRYFVIRDPSGMLPCFVTSHRGVQIWFSNLEDLSPLDIPEPAIDWNHVALHVVSRVVHSHATALTGIEEIRAGESCDVEGRQLRRRNIWDPVAISNTQVLEDAAAAAQSLHAVTRACIGAWAASYEGILHTLSGGLDSSIVAVLLGQAPSQTPATCVNYFTSEAEGDERRYARDAAQKAGFELIEHRRTPRTVDMRSLLNISTAPNPWFYLYQLEHGEFECGQAHRRGAGVIFTGGGGDGIFYHSQAGYSVADYVQRHGLTSRLLTIALDAARLEGKSLSTVLWRALADRNRRSRRSQAIEHAKRQTLVSAETIASQAAILQSRFDSARRDDVPIGKRWHILTTSTPPGFYDPFNNPLALERIPPLVSQPIVEVCLRIPTYVLVESGWDRAIARRAFAADLPLSVVNRRGKGAITNHVRSIVEANLRFIREFLLDGELVARGFLNRKHLETCLAGKSMMTAAEFTEITDHISTEAWIHARNRNKAASVAA